MLATECLQPMKDSEITSFKTLNFKVLDELLNDQINYKGVLSPDKMMRVAEECIKMNQNKELLNKLRTALTKGNVFEYSMDDYMRLFKILSIVP